MNNPGDAAVTTATKTDDRRRVLGAPVSAIVELSILMALILVVDQLLADGLRFRDLQPHPFWVPVLLLTVQYGTGAGLMAAVAASLALTIGNLPADKPGQDLYAYLFSVSLNPLLWAVAAVVLGELRNRQVRARAGLERAIADARTQAATIADAYEKLKHAKHELEVEIAGQMRTVASVYEGARAIERASVAEVLDGVDDMARAVLGARKSSLFLIDGDDLVLARESNWQSSDTYARTFPRSSPLFRDVIGRRAVVAVNDPVGVRTLNGEGLMAGPVSAAGGSVIGMIKIEDMGFTDLTLTALENFRIVGDWVGNAIQRARQAEGQTAAPRVDGPRPRHQALLPGAVFRDDKAFLERFGGPREIDACLLVIRPRNIANLDADARDAFANALGAAVNEVLPDTDRAYDIDDDGANPGILVAHLPHDQSRPVMDALKAAIRRHLPEPLRSQPLQVQIERLARPEHAWREPGDG